MSEKQIYPSDTADKVLVRMPDGMREQLKVAAKSNNRTMNAEIVARLQDTFAGATLPHPDDFKGSWLAKLAGRLHDLQGKRNALALVIHALKSSNSGADEILRVQQELEALDLAIGKVVVSIQTKESTLSK